MKNDVITKNGISEKDRKRYILACKYCKIFSVINLIYSFFSVIFFTTVFVMNMAGISVITVFNATPTDIAMYVECIIVGITLTVVFYFLIQIIDKLKDGNSPFKLLIADKIKKISIAFIACGASCTVIEYLIFLLNSNGAFGENSTYEPYGEYNIFISFGIIIFVLAYIFSYGCKLQQESDETV